VVAKRAVQQFLCILLLLFAQQAALTHSVWHLRDYLPAQEHHGHGSAPHEHGDDGGTPSSQAELCVFHAALGSLFAGGCTAQPTVAAAEFFHWLSTPIVVRLVPQATLTPPSRAPPVLL
jgi:hypothetical protein